MEQYQEYSSSADVLTIKSLFNTHNVSYINKNNLAFIWYGDQRLEKTVIFWQMIENLTKDAKFIVNLIFTPTHAFAALVKARGNGTVKIKKSIIGEHLTQDLKWTQHRVRKAFKEIIKTI
jgi:hypothetical protein